MAEERKYGRSEAKEDKPKTEEQKKAEWKKAEEAQVPHPFITPNPPPGGPTALTAEAEPITVEEQTKQSIPTDPIAAHDTPASNKKFRDEIEDKIMEAAGHPEPLRVGNELTRAENGILTNISRVMELQAFLQTEEVQDKLDDEQKKKMSELIVTY